MPEEQERFCFVICPIGAAGSPVRQRADGVFEEIIRPVAAEMGFMRVERADHDKSPGIITESIIRKVTKADLVIADLTDQNPNVMYELALRHTVGLPFVQMVEKEQALPFDIGGVNTIHFSADLHGAGKARADLQRAVTAAMREGSAESNPVRRAIRLDHALESEGIDAGVREVLLDLRDEISELRGALSRRSSTGLAFTGIDRLLGDASIANLRQMRFEAEQRRGAAEQEVDVLRHQLTEAEEEDRPSLLEQLQLALVRLGSAKAELDSLNPRRGLLDVEVPPERE